MKKLMLFAIMSMMASIGIAQTLTVVNNTSEPIIVGAQVGDSPNLCDWGTLTSGELILPSGTLIIPLGASYTYRVGAHVDGDPGTFRWETCPGWNPACAGSAGTAFTFTWTGCNYIEIDD